MQTHVLRHQPNLAAARAQHDRVATHVGKCYKWKLPDYPASKCPSKFLLWSRAIIHCFTTAGWNTILDGTLTGLGPNAVVLPANNAINALNVECITVVDHTIYSLIESTFTEENHGHADAATIPRCQGAALFAHLTLLNNGTAANDLDDTREKFHTMKQTTTQTPKAFIQDVRIRRNALVMAGSAISDLAFHKAILKGLIIPESTRVALRLQTNNTTPAFLQSVEDVVSYDELPRVHKRKAEAPLTIPDSSAFEYGITCFNCGIKGHYASACPDPYDPNMRQQQLQAAGIYQAGRAGRGGRGHRGGRGGREGRGGRGGKGHGGRGGKTNTGGRGDYTTYAAPAAATWNHYSPPTPH